MTARQSIYFIRHGQKQASQTHNSIKNKNLRLTSVGLFQSRVVAQFLKTLDIKQVYSSDYPRAIDTANITSKLLGLPVVIKNGFGERILFTHEVDDKISKREFIKSQKDWSYRNSGGESLISVTERFTRTVNEVLADSNNDTAVFTHGRALQTYLSNNFPGVDFDLVSLIISPGDVYRVDYENGVPVDWSFVFAPAEFDSLVGKTISTLADTLVIRKLQTKKILKTHILDEVSGHNIPANIYEKESLDLLQSIGLSVPGKRKLLGQGRYISMNYISGDTFGDLLSGGKDTLNISKKAGTLLRIFHDKINKNTDNLTIEINTPNANLNAQCAINFNALTSKLCNEKLQSPFSKAVRLAEGIILKNPQYLQSPDIIYGDFKPDNLVVGSHGIYLIDPHLSYGRLSCDVGKMISRLYLINPKKASENIDSFLSGYKPTANMLREIRHMAGMDILNTYSRIVAKNQLSDKTDILSHRQTLKNIEYCISQVVPSLFNDSEIVILRHLDDIQDFRVHYRNTPIIETEKEKVPFISASILEKLKDENKKKIHIITSPQVRAEYTAKLIVDAVRSRSLDIEVTISKDVKIMDLYHGRYVIPEDYVVGEKLPALSISNRVYTEQTFTYRNLDYRNGDPLEGAYPSLEGLFSEYGETQRSFSIRFYDFIESFLEDVAERSDTLFVIVAHTAIVFRLFELSYLIKDIATSSGGVDLGELSFLEWGQAYRLDRNPGNQLFIAPGEMKYLDIGHMLGYSWRFKDEVDYLRKTAP